MSKFHLKKSYYLSPFIVVLIFLSGCGPSKNIVEISYSTSTLMRPLTNHKKKILKKVTARMDQTEDIFLEALRAKTVKEFEIAIFELADRTRVGFFQFLFTEISSDATPLHKITDLIFYEMKVLRRHMKKLRRKQLEGTKTYNELGLLHNKLNRIMARVKRIHGYRDEARYMETAYLQRRIYRNTLRRG